MRERFRASWLLSLVILTGCQIKSDRSLKNPQTEIVIGAAASLQDVISQIAPLYERQYPQQKVTTTFASSGTIQRQITQGAPIDVFISADRVRIDTLAQQNLLAKSSIQNLANNQLALVTGNRSLEVSTFIDLAKDEVQTVAMGEPNTVPGGKYAQEVLAFYDLVTLVAEKAVYGKDIRQVLNYVITQNADLGLVYLTDALSSQEDLAIIAIAPPDSHSPIDYAIAITQASQNPDLANNFIDFLLTAPVQAIFRQQGFLILSDND